MSNTDPVERLYGIVNRNGRQHVLDVLTGSVEDTDVAEQLDTIVDEIGQDRTEQLLGVGDLPWVTLWVTNRSSDLSDKRQELVNRLKDLWDDGKIASFSTNRVPPTVRREGPHTRRDHVERHRQFRRWARQHGLTLSAFDRTDDAVKFPGTFLTVRNVHYRTYSLPTEDRDPTGLVAVFPCFDGTTRYTVRSYLEALDEGQHWRSRTAQMGITTPDYGDHGSIKARLAQSPTDTVGPNWTTVDDEEYVGYTTVGGSGRLDLLFKHVEEERYLLVEVKPDPDDVDTAFGQVGRYRHQFLADSGIPSLGVDDVEVAIAAPEFREPHRELADEWDVRLITVNP